MFFNCCFSAAACDFRSGGESSKISEPYLRSSSAASAAAAQDTALPSLPLGGSGIICRLKGEVYAHQYAPPFAAPAAVFTAVASQPPSLAPLSATSFGSMVSIDLSKILFAVDDTKATLTKADAAAMATKAGEGSTVVVRCQDSDEGEDGVTGGSCSIVVVMLEDSDGNNTMDKPSDAGRGAVAPVSGDSDDDAFDAWEKEALSLGQQRGADGGRPPPPPPCLCIVPAGEAPADVVARTADSPPSPPDGCSPAGRRASLENCDRRGSTGSGGRPLCFRDGMVISKRMDMLLEKRRQQEEQQQQRGLAAPGSSRMLYLPRTACSPSPWASGAQVWMQRVRSELGSGVAAGLRPVQGVQRVHSEVVRGIRPPQPGSPSSAFRSSGSFLRLSMLMTGAGLQAQSLQRCKAAKPQKQKRTHPSALAAQPMTGPACMPL